MHANVRPIPMNSIVLAQAKRYAELLTAFAAGETIGFSPVDQRGTPNRDWLTVGELPSWNFASFDYKIKPAKPQPLEMHAIVRTSPDKTRKVVLVGDAAGLTQSLMTYKGPDRSDLRVVRLVEEIAA